jgi:hypothetical protein
MLPAAAGPTHDSGNRTKTHLGGNYDAITAVLRNWAEEVKESFVSLNKHL